MHQIGILRQYAPTNQQKKAQQKNIKTISPSQKQDEKKKKKKKPLSTKVPKTP